MEQNKTATGEETPAKVDQPIDPNQPKPKEEEKKSDEGAIDHKAAAEALKAELDQKSKELAQAQHTIIALKKKKDPKSDGEGDDKGDDNEQVGPEAVEKLVESVKEKIRQDNAVDIIQEELLKLTSDPDEIAHIKLVYETKIVHSGYSKADIIKDLENARAIANAPRILKNSEEIRRAAQAKSTTEQAGGSAGASIESDKPTDTKYNASEMALFQMVSNKMGIPIDKIIKKS